MIKNFQSATLMGRNSFHIHFMTFAKKSENLSCKEYFCDDSLHLFHKSTFLLNITGIDSAKTVSTPGHQTKIERAIVQMKKHQHH